MQSHVDEDREISEMPKRRSRDGQPQFLDSDSANEGNQRSKGVRFDDFCRSMTGSNGRDSTLFEVEDPT